MEEQAEIVDDTFGRLSLVDESAYFGEVLWNREINIRLFVHVDGKDYRRCIESARGIFLAVRTNELTLFRQGIDVVGADEWEDGFLNNAAETSIEIFSNGEGQLVYLLWMVGSLIIKFSRDAGFKEACVVPG
jgi:hypothetical protein